MARSLLFQSLPAISQCKDSVQYFSICWRFVDWCFFFLPVLWHLITCWRHLSFPWSIKFHWWGSVQTGVWHSLLTPGLISFMKFITSPRYASSFFLSKITLPNHLFYSGFCWFSSQLLHFFPSFMLSSILLLERAFHLWGLINLFTHLSVSLLISVFQEA